MTVRKYDRVGFINPKSKREEDVFIEGLKEPYRMIWEGLFTWKNIGDVKGMTSEYLQRCLFEFGTLGFLKDSQGNLYGFGVSNGQKKSFIQDTYIDWKIANYTPSNKAEHKKMASEYHDEPYIELTKIPLSWMIERDVKMIAQCDGAMEQNLLGFSQPILLQTGDVDDIQDLIIEDDLTHGKKIIKCVPSSVIKAEVLDLKVQDHISPIITARKESESRIYALLGVEGSYTSDKESGLSTEEVASMNRSCTLLAREYLRRLQEFVITVNKKLGTEIEVNLSEGYRMTDKETERLEDGGEE